MVFPLQSGRALGRRRRKRRRRRRKHSGLFLGSMLVGVLLVLVVGLWWFTRGTGSSRLDVPSSFTAEKDPLPLPLRTGSSSLPGSAATTSAAASSPGNSSTSTQSHGIVSPGAILPRRSAALDSPVHSSVGTSSAAGGSALTATTQPVMQTLPEIDPASAVVSDQEAGNTGVMPEGMSGGASGEASGGSDAGNTGGPGGTRKTSDGAGETSGGTTAEVSGGGEVAPGLSGRPMVEPDLTLPPDASMAQVIAHGMGLIEQGHLVQARSLLSDLLVLREKDLAHANARIIRTALTKVSQELVFSKRVVPGDPVATMYVIQSGDYLSTLARREHITYQLIEQINQIKATRIWPGMKIKLIHGPFHAVVDKSDYRMDIYLEHPKTRQRLFVISYPIGLGEQDSTPVGQWIVKPASKVINPSWPDPKSGKFYQPDDPANPIGEYWIGLTGIDSHTRGKRGYGIHGTIDNASIGQQRSMGCIRMLNDHLEWVFKMLVERSSRVTIQR